MTTVTLQRSTLPRLTANGNELDLSPDCFGEVLEARHEMTRRLAAEGHLDARFPHEEAVAGADTTVKFHAELAIGNEPLMRVLDSGPMMEFYERYFNAMCHTSRAA
jgi:hypothetical protein